MCIAKKDLTCPTCNRSFKRKDHSERPFWETWNKNEDEDETEAKDLPCMINSFEVSSLLHSWIPLSTKQENKVNNQTSDQL